MSFEAGPYKWEVFLSPDYSNLGVVEAPPKVIIQTHHQEVRGDNLGMSLQDAIYLGHTTFIELIFQEWNAANFKLWWQFSTGNTAQERILKMTDIGCAVSTIALPVRASRIFSCPANGGNQFYFDRIALAPNYPIEWLMGSRLRNVPVRFVALPYEYTTGAWRIGQVVN